MRLDVEIVRDTRGACSLDYTIIIQLSLLDLVEGGGTWEEVKTLAQALEDGGMIILNQTSAGTRRGFMLVSDAMCVGHTDAMRSSLAR